MKRIPFILLVLAVLAILAFPVWAQMGAPMHEAGSEEEAPAYGPGWGGYGHMMGPGYGGYGMGPGMMGPGYGGYGMGPGMMGPGGWSGCGMMGPGYGYGMGPGMMGPGYGGYGMGSGMMGPGYGYGQYGWKSSKEAQKFLDATKDIRKELHMKMFDYMEMVRSGASQEKLEAAWKEIDKLRMELYNKVQEMMK